MVKSVTKSKKGKQAVGEFQVLHFQRDTIQVIDEIWVEAQASDFRPNLDPLTEEEIQRFRERIVAEMSTVETQ